MTSILVFSGSSRPGSINHTLAALAAKTIEAAGASATLISLADFPLPMVTAAGFGNAPWLARLSPYVGGGIGISQVTLRRQGISATGVVMDGSDTRLTWQLSAGVSYAIFDKTAFELGYRHMRTSGLEFEARDGTVSKTDLVNNMVTVGIRRSF